MVKNALAHTQLIEDYEANENFADLFEESFSDSLTEGSVSTGTVVGVQKDTVIIDIGLKSEGRIPMKEFAQAGVVPEIVVGDEFDVYVERFEDRNGEAVLSREKALREESWAKLEEKWKNSERVEGVIFSRVKGGFTVDIQGAVAFLPGSQVDIRPIKDISPLMNVPQPFQILKMDRKRGNIVVSRRAVLEESRVEARNELLDNISEGQVLEGMVKNITDYGAFIDMGGVDGLLHVTDISWKRINHPSEVFSVGDTIKVVVTKFDEKTKRVSLGMKQLESNPWEGIKEQFAVGTRFNGKITNITDYGAFVELKDGIEGLVHVSEMSWTKKNAHPSKIVNVGDEVEVIVLDIDPDKHRISLGMKQCASNPWEAFAAENPVGNIVEGQVRNITDFGLFVGLDNDIDGLVHHSDISWSDNGEEAIQSFNKGDTVKAKVLLVDVEKERISLGIKQLDESGASAAAETSSSMKKNQVVTCTVSAVQKDGIEVSFGEEGKETTAFIKRADLSRDRQEQRPDRFAVGDRVDAKVISTDKKTGKANLSIKAYEIDEHKRAIEEYGSSDSGASLGAILGAALEEAGGAKEEAAEEKPKKASKAKKAKDADAAESSDE
ncbi:MAG: 30S ribosomal protein S1 [Rickettsiales bacterium]|nr:30S ribosomal protein S1 [Rickettsiales bacterium]